MTHDPTSHDSTDRSSAVGGRTSDTSRRAFLSAVGAGATAVAAGAGLPATTAAAAGDRTLPWLYRDGNEIKDPEDNRVVLHGVNVPDPKRGRPEWGHMHTEDAVELATNADRGWNSRVIRLPMQPQDIGDHGPGSVDPVAFDSGQLADYCETYVDPVVEKCRERGAYIMLDYHRHWPDGPNWTDDAVDEEIRMFWEYVAARYADQSHVIFEVYNEPTTPYPGAGDPTTGVDVTDPVSEETWDHWRETAQPWVDLIRDHAAHQIIVIGSPRWSQWTYWAANGTEFEGDNLAYAGHVYAHENLRPLSTYFGEPSEEVPVFMSEFGWEPGQESPYLTGSREVEGQQFRDLYEEYDTMHAQAWCFDHSWTPDLLDQDYDNDEFLVREGWGEWTVDFLADRADLYLPEAPTDAGPVDPGDGSSLDAPSTVETTAVGETFAEIEWTSVDDATTYLVYLGSDQVAETSDTTATIDGLDSDSTYQLGVSASDGEEESSATTIAVTTGGGDDVCALAGADDQATVDGQAVCDVDGDGNFRDVNADGSVSNGDITEFFSNQHAPAWDERTELFDFDGDDDVGQSDVVDLFHYVNGA